jgi:hypothetical protein
MPASTSTRIFGARLDAKAVIGFAIATALGVLLAAFPIAGLAGLAAVLIPLGIMRWCKGRLETEAWQILVLVSMTLFIVLNYGFDSFILSLGGMHILVGESLMFAALGLVLFGRHRSLLFSALHEPPVICLLALLILALIHLAIDVPHDGLFAIRDSAKYIEMVFLGLGYLWGSQKRYTPLLLKWLLFLYVLNLAYSSTFPWAEQLLSWSPKAGMFHPIAVLGQYEDNALYLLTGAMFCAWIASSVVRWPRWVLVSLSAAQLCGLAILQARSMYVGLVLVLVILFFLRETSKIIQFASVLPWAAGALLTLVLVTSALGIQLHGRVGPVNLAFLEEHAQTVFALGNERVRMGADTDRERWYSDIWERESSSPARLIFGEGFGKPLVDLQNEEGIPVREPHNSTLSVFARLGMLGLVIWLLFIFLVIRRFVYVIRRRLQSDEMVFRLTLFLFSYFVLAMVVAIVQPALEFSHSDLPFLFLLGVALGMMRWQAEEVRHSSSPMISAHAVRV